MTGTAFLLDVNVLIALMWPAHEAHLPVQRWFSRSARHGWATCPFTQADFVRIVSNPAFSPHAVSPEEAIDLLSANILHNEHRFWGDEVTFFAGVGPLRPRIVGHRQITDAYLLGLALHKKGKLATLDRSILSLVDPAGEKHEWIEIIPE